jgi:hypothetical protein
MAADSPPPHPPGLLRGYSYSRPGRLTERYTKGFLSEQQSASQSDHHHCVHLVPEVDRRNRFCRIANQTRNATCTPEWRRKDHETCCARMSHTAHLNQRLSAPRSKLGETLEVDLLELCSKPARA